MVRRLRVHSIAAWSILWLVAGTLAFAGEAAAPPAAGAKRDIKLHWFTLCGLRADPDLFRMFEFARQGLYPNIKKLMEQGSFGYSIPTYPSHTPTNFATLMTGAYPETHGVADGPMRLEGYPLAKPTIMGFSSTAKRVEPVWKLFERQGKDVVVVSVPGSTPPELESGVTLRGRWGRWGADFFALNFESADNPLERVKRGTGVRLFFMGPELTRFVKTAPASGWTGAPASFSPPLEVELEGYGARLYAYLYDVTDDGKAGYDAAAFSWDKKSVAAVLKSSNEWSSWLPVALRWNGEAIESQVKICLIKLDASGFVKVRLYYDLLNRTTVQPAELSADIKRVTGPMVDFVDNWPAQLNRYPEEKAVFLTEALMALDWHRKVVSYFYEHRGPDVMIHNTYVPNQALESRWWLRHVDPEHADYRLSSDADRAQAWKDIHAIYQGVDAILGEAMAHVSSDTLVVLSADHGTIPLNRYFHVNNLLAKEGLLKFTTDPATGEPVVDWANTKAIHLIMTGVYLHPGGLAGNWKRGSGPEYEALRKKVRRLLERVEDDGKHPLREVVPWEQVGGLRLPKDRVADLVLVVKPGYGLSEEMSPSLEVFSKPLQSGYKQALVADQVPGLWTPFIVMGPGVKRGYALKKLVRNADQAPTLLTLMGIPVPETMQGRVVREILAD